MLSGGSSPLARGLLVRVEHRTQREGIIPARAGFTSLTRAARSPLRDHPRSRGVYHTSSWTVISVVGSSPLARGLPCNETPQNWRVGIIPARAGFTSLTRAARSPLRDHPRSRGVYHTSSWTVISVVGSSPLARGLPCNETPQNWRVGIIPARAGFTWPEK